VATISSELGAVTSALPRRWVMLWSAPHLVMVIAGALAFLLVLAVLRDRTATVEVAVLSADLSAGDTLTAEAVRYEELPAAVGGLVDMPDRAAIDRAVEERWHMGVSLDAGALLRLSDITPPDAFVGQRLMSIAVDPASSVGGTLVRGDVVDVISTAEGRARFVATDVAVAGATSAEQIGRSTFSVTLAVDAEQSLRIAEAAASGTVTLVRTTGAGSPPEASTGA